jgi:hypothetical protein
MRWNFDTEKTAVGDLILAISGNPPAGRLLLA